MQHLSWFSYIINGRGISEAIISAQQVQKADKTLTRDSSWLPRGFHTATAALVHTVLPCWKEEELGGGLVSRLHGRVNGRGKYCRGG